MKSAIILLFKISLFFLVPICGFAEDLMTFEEVITARRSLLLENSPSEQKISEDQFQTQKHQTVESIVKQLPAISVSDPYNATSSVFYRGADSEKLLVLVDDIVMNDPTSPSGGFDFRTLQPSEIEEMRLWSPGEAVAWGPGALGGILSIRTKRKVPRVFSASLGSYRTYQLGLGTGFERGYWTTSFSASGLQSEGVSSAAPWTGASELDGRTRSNLRFQANRQGESSNQRVQLFYTSGSENTDKSPPGDDPNAFSNLQSSVLSFHDERHPNSQSEIHSSVSIRKILRNESDAPDALSASYSYSKEDASEVMMRFQYLTLLHENLKIDTGLDYQDSAAAFEFSDSFGPSSGAFSKRAMDVGTFLRFHQKFEKSKLIPGIRAQLNQEGQVNPLTSLRYQWDFAQGIHFEYHAATGIKEPTIYQRYSSYGKQSLNSEKVEYHHFGIGGEISSQRFLILAFQQWYRDLIQFNSSTSKYDNIATAQTKGLEFQYAYDFGRAKLQLSGSEIFARDGDGISLLRRPRQQLSVSSDYSMEKLRLAPLLIWKGTREDSYSGSRVFLPSTTQLDLGWSYVHRVDFVIEGAIQNILGHDLVEVYGYQGLGRRAEVGFRYFW